MKKLMASSFVALLLFCSCSSTAKGPPNHSSFVTIKNISELAGTYKNRGQPGDVKFRSIYLSTILWPLDMDLKHEVIQTISVVEVAPGTLEAKALSDNVVVKVGRFVENQDFTLEEGRIMLRHEAGLAGLQAGAPLLDPCPDGSESGLDANERNKCSDEYTVAGLTFLLFPVAADLTEEFFYEKLPETKQSLSANGERKSTLN